MNEFFLNAWRPALLYMIIFAGGVLVGEASYHNKIHERFTEKCPTHELHHSVSGSHICHLDGGTVQQLD